jgi:enoyl-CoA hydratase/carnithine racemase
VTSSQPASGAPVPPSVHVHDDGPVRIVTIDRPDRRNAVDLATSHALIGAFTEFDGDAAAAVAVLTGAGGTFCAGADLKALAAGEGRPMHEDGLTAPMGPTRLLLSKPVIAAVEGHAVAGGLELALWADLRVVAADAVLGVFCRRFGVPLADLGTIRLPRLVGHGRAMDLILTGRPVAADEALAIGLADRVVPPGQARAAAVALGHQLARLPQRCLRNDRLSAIEQWSLPEGEAVRNEIRHALDTIASGETLAGAGQFAAGLGRHGQPAPGPA